MTNASNDNERHPVALVAEDDPLMRRLMVIALERDGFDVLEARDGAELASWIRRVFEEHVDSHAIDVIVSDQRMPTATGLESLARLRRSDWCTPFILITAFGDRSTIAEALRLGAAVLDKPFDLAVLRRTARHLAIGAA